MKVNIVIPNSGWILDKIGKRVVEANKELDSGVEMKLSSEPRADFDINYYIDCYNCYRKKTNTIDISWLNAFHGGFQPHWKSLDFIVFQNKKYQKKMIEKGYPKEQTKVIYPGIFLDKFRIKKTVLGVFQRGNHEDKGHDFMMELPNVCDLENFKFLFVGKGWGDVYNFYSKSGIDVNVISDESYDSYPSHYQKIDYLLIPSLIEGGPMCLLEALAMGIPTISSKVGSVPDFDVEYMFEPGEVMGLAKILMDLEKEKLERRKKVENLTWKNHTKQLIKVFEKCLKKQE